MHLRTLFHLVKKNNIFIVINYNKVNCIFKATFLWKRGRNIRFELVLLRGQSYGNRGQWQTGDRNAVRRMFLKRGIQTPTSICNIFSICTRGKSYFHSCLYFRNFFMMNEGKGERENEISEVMETRRHRGKSSSVVSARCAKVEWCNFSIRFYFLQPSCLVSII